MLIDYLYPHKVAISLMATLNIGGRGRPPVVINALPEPSIDKLRHGNRIKIIRGPNNTEGSIPIDLNNRDYEGELDSNTIQIVTTFIQEYAQLIAALARNQIDNDEFTRIYYETKVQGIRVLPQLIQDIIGLPHTLQKISQRPSINLDAPYRHQMPTIEGLQTIRGVRMLQFLAEESTYAELERKTRAFKPVTKRRQFAVDPIKIVNLDITPYLGTKMLLFRGLATSSKGGGRYKTIVSFSKVKFEPESTNTNVTFTASDGEEYSVQPIKLSNNNARVRCQCLDFYYRFSAFDYNDKSLYGRAPRPYVRKTPPPPLGRPWANPMKTPGVCKHVLKTVQSLMDAGLVVR